MTIGFPTNKPEPGHNLISADQLVVNDDERDATGDLRLHLEAVQHIDERRETVVHRQTCPSATKLAGTP